MDDAPISARKILQNAVWGLRRVLTQPDAPDGSTALMTQAPGYKLSVDPNDIDLFRFQHQVDAGREALAADEPERAARILREGLALWRGPVLADLVEAGIDWPELSAAQNARWAATEDYFEAELACGRHLAVLSELEAMVESTALRERSCGQLMLALYRSGRQADALNVYSRVRAALVEELGLEPGRELQTLQQAILAHDPVLTLPAATAPVVVLPVAVPPPAVPNGEPVAHGAVVPDRAAAPGERALAPGASHAEPVTAYAGAAREPAPVPRAVSAYAADPRARAVLPRRELAVVSAGAPVSGAVSAAAATVGARVPEQGGAGAHGERTCVSALLVQAQLGPQAADVDPRSTDEMLEEVALRIRENIEHFGGTVSATIGSVSMAFFGAEESCEDAAERAVMASLTIGDDLRPGSGGVRTMPLPQGLSFHAAVVTGEALVRYRPQGGSPLSVTGSLVDRCHMLLSHAAPGEIRACEKTRRATAATVVHRRTDTPGEWTVHGIRRDDMGQELVPTVEREYELDLLRGLVERTRHRSTSHLVTVLGDAGTGKTRFLAEFDRQVSDRTYLARFQVLLPVANRRPEELYGGLSPVHAVQRDLVNAICSIQPGDSTREARDKLVATIRRLVDDESRVARLLECLLPYVDPEAGDLVLHDTQLELTSWRQFLERTVLDKPLVLLVDDLHRADDELLDFVSGLADLSRVPVFVVTSARPDLLRRRPDWGGGKRHITTITLEALSDAAVDQLIDFLLSPARDEQERSTRWFHKRLDANAGDRPDERRKYIRSLFSMSAPRRFFGGNGVRCVTTGDAVLSGGRV